MCTSGHFNEFLSFYGGFLIHVGRKHGLVVIRGVRLPAGGLVKLYIFEILLYIVGISKIEISKIFNF